jgi:hypothetical protein
MATIGKVVIKQPIRTTITNPNVNPAPNVSMSDVKDVSLDGLQDGYTLIYDSATNKFKVESASDLTGTITIITGGTF